MIEGKSWYNDKNHDTYKNNINCPTKNNNNLNKNSINLDKKEK